MIGAELTLVAVAGFVLKETWGFALGFCCNKLSDKKLVIGDFKNHDVPKQVAGAWSDAVDKTVRTYCNAPPHDVSSGHREAIDRVGAFLGKKAVAEDLFVSAAATLRLVPGEEAAKAFAPDALTSVAEQVERLFRAEAKRVVPTSTIPDSFFTHVRAALMPWVTYYYVERAIKLDDKSRHQIMWELARESYLLLLTFRETLDGLDPAKLADAVAAELQSKIEAALKDTIPPWPEAEVLLKKAAYDGGKYGGFAGGKEGAAAGVADGFDAALAKLGPGGLRAIAENQELRLLLEAKDAELAGLRDAAQQGVQAQARGGNAEAKAVVAEIRESGDLSSLQQYLIAESGAAQPSLEAAIAEQVVRCKQIVAIAANRNDWRTVAQWGEVGLRLAPEDELLLLFMADFAVAYGDTVRARSLLTTLRDRIGERSEDKPGDSDILRQLSVAHTRIGNVQVAQGELSDALASFRADMAIAEKLAARDPGNTQWQRDLSVSHNKIGDVQVARGELSDALASFKAGMVIREKLAAHDPGNTRWQRDLSVSHNKIGVVQAAQGELSDALASYKAGMAIAKMLAARDRGNTEWQRDLSISHNKLGGVQVAQGELPDALASFKAGMAIAERLAARDPGNTQWQRDLSVSHNKIGVVQVAQGELSDALASFEADMEIAEKLAAHDPGNTEWQRDLFVSHSKLAAIHLQLNATNDARSHFESGRGIMVRLVAHDPTNAQWRKDLAWLEARLTALDE